MPENNLQSAKDTESMILEAAEKEFMAKGFAGARTTSIAEAAGVTHAMFHYYFRTKEKLFERIIESKATIIVELFKNSIIDASVSLEETLKRFIDSHLEFIADNPQLPIFFITEIYSNKNRAERIVTKIASYAPIIICHIQSLIDMEASTGRCRKVDAKMLILDLVSLNVFSYMAYPVVNAALGNCMENKEKFLEERKKNNYDTIMRKLKP